MAELPRRGPLDGRPAASAMRAAYARDDRGVTPAHAGSDDARARQAASSVTRTTPIPGAAVAA